jgi:hypothetical protein
VHTSEKKHSCQSDLTKFWQAIQLNMLVAELCQGMEFMHSRLFSLSTLQYVCAIMDHGP